MFDGEPSHLKRFSDTSESLIYHLYHLTDLAARVYFADTLADKVRFYTSPDGGRWPGIEFAHATRISSPPLGQIRLLSSSAGHSALMPPKP